MAGLCGLCRLSAHPGVHDGVGSCDPALDANFMVDASDRRIELLAAVPDVLAGGCGAMPILAARLAAAMPDLPGSPAPDLDPGRNGPGAAECRGHRIGLCAWAWRAGREPVGAAFSARK